MTDPGPAEEALFRDLQHWATTLLYFKLGYSIEYFRCFSIGRGGPPSSLTDETVKNFCCTIFRYSEILICSFQATEAVHGVLEVLPDPVSGGGSTTNRVRRREGFGWWCWSDQRVQVSQLWVFVSMCRSALVDGRSTCLPICRASCRYTMQTFYDKGLGYDLFILDNHGSVARKVLAAIWFHHELWKTVW